MVAAQAIGLVQNSPPRRPWFLEQLGMIVQQLADLSHTRRWPEVAQIVSVVLDCYRARTDPEPVIVAIEEWEEQRARRASSPQP